MAKISLTTSDANRSPSIESGLPTSLADAPQPTYKLSELKSEKPVEAVGAAKFNRRSIMNMMVTTAIVGTAIETEAKDTTTNPDAEVLAAAKAFEPLLTKYLDVRFVWMRLAREARAALNVKFPVNDFKGPTGKDPKWIFHRQLLDQNGCTETSDRLSAIHEDMQPLADLIRSSGTETIEGLRAKTLVAIWECQPMCASHDGHFDFDNPESHWSLFTAAVAVTGLSDLVSALDDRLQADAIVSSEEDADEVIEA